MRLPPARAAMTLVVATALAWLIVATTGRAPLAALIGGFIPARVTGLSLPGAAPVWLTPLTATLLHGGVAHLAMNMLMLGFCGRFVEPAVGARGMVALYVVSAYAAAAAQWAWSPYDATPMVGASGAISGVFAVYALLYGQRRPSAAHPRLARWLHVLWLAAAWIGINLLVALATLSGRFSVAVPAHVGGFLAGLALTRPLLRWRFGRPVG